MSTAIDPGIPTSFKNILLATDFSAAACAAYKVALALCLRNGACLRILHVFEYADAYPGEFGSDVAEVQGLFADAWQRLRQLVDDAHREGVAAVATMGSGVAAVSVLDAVRAHETDLVIVGTRAIKGMERFVFGSTTEAVVRKSPCPVVTVGPHARFIESSSAHPVLFATDFQPSTVAASQLAASVSAFTAAPLHCLHVLPADCEPHARANVIPEIMEGALRRVADNSGAQALGTQTPGTRLPPPVISIRYADQPAEEIIAYAREHHASAIVLGVHRAGPFAAHIPAQIAYRIIAGAPCPVWTIAFAIQHQPHPDTTPVYA